MSLSGEADWPYRPNVMRSYSSAGKKHAGLKYQNNNNKKKQSNWI